MNQLQPQQGVGLVEVLVALLLLAVAVLGYTALQLRAVDASSEALSRSQAIMIMRGVTESIRANTTAQANYPAAIRSYTNITNSTTEATSCQNSTCTAQQFATYEAYQAARSALSLGMRITMTDCPGVQQATVKRQCLFAAWDDTVITANDYTNCISTEGIYLPQAHCLMMEAY